MSYIGGYAGLVAIAVATHALVGYVLGRVLFDAPAAGLLGGVAPDIDLLFLAIDEWPLVHRGPTHSLAAAGVAVGVAFALSRDRSVAGAVGVGYLAQLVVDASTPSGIPALWPLTRQIYELPLNGHAYEETVVLWVLSLAVLWYDRRRQ